MLLFLVGLGDCLELLRCVFDESWMVIVLILDFCRTVVALLPQVSFLLIQYNSDAAKHRYHRVAGYRKAHRFSDGEVAIAFACSW